MPDELSLLDLVAQADLVRRGETEPLELVDAAIERAERLDPQLNAIVSAQFERARAEAVSPDLPEGETELKFNFIKTREFGGTGELYVNGKKVAERDMPQMHISTYSLAETFDIGRDTGTQVSRIYDDPFIFNGSLDRVTIRLND